MNIPSPIQNVLTTLKSAGFEAFVVGGSVRDMLRGASPKDWDVTTSARPEDIQKLFPEHVYENTFGTVSVKTGSEDPTLALVEVTPYRVEGTYSDRRHPDAVSFAQTLEEDLSRRDFTINAIALGDDGAIIDPFEGQKDIREGTIRTVGDPRGRFGEDALRILRAARLSAELGYGIEPETLAAMRELGPTLEAISVERIRDEFTKIIASPRAYEGVVFLQETDLLRYIIPELLEGVGVSQNLHHIYTVWEHNARALKYATEQNYSLIVRLACLLHDVGKPRTKRGEGTHSTFYGHDVVGGRMAKAILLRLKYSKDIVERVTTLVRYHLFYYNVGEVTESSVRRLLAKVGKENMDDLLRVREGDRIGSGTPKAVPYKLRHLKYMIDKVSSDPISVKMLAINGETLMQELGMQPGPRMGLVLNGLLADVLDTPAHNTKEQLLALAKEYGEMPLDSLRTHLAKIEAAREAEEAERMKKYYVSAAEPVAKLPQKKV